MPAGLRIGWVGLQPEAGAAGTHGTDRRCGRKFWPFLTDLRKCISLWSLPGGWAAGRRVRCAECTAKWRLFFLEWSMLPAKKKSRTRTRTKRAHHALRPQNVVSCPKCRSAKLPHAACENCGYVSSRVALALKEKEA